MNEIDILDKKNENYLISVGIDIGTTTTQIVFSKLLMEEKRGYGLISQVSIKSKQAIYKSPIYETPLLNMEQIDAEGINKLVEKSYEEAGLTEADVDTGAIIITGETARKRNAKKVIEAIADYVGHFIAYAAGGHLESILAGKGSGAEKLSKDTGKTVVNFDIGGGTTNIACFQSGELIGTACLLIGARGVRVKNGQVSFIAPHINKIIAKKNISISVGDLLDDETTIKELRKLVGCMVSAFLSVVHLNQEETYLNHLLEGEVQGEILTPDYVTFSGGVAECIWNENETFLYNDIGFLLGDAIRKSMLMEYHDKNGNHGTSETIQATVIGASQFAVSLSGATICSNKFPFPYNNIPVITLSNHSANTLQIESDMELDRASDQVYAIYIESESYMNYRELDQLTERIITFINKQDKYMKNASEKQPFVCVFKADIAKAVGQMLKRKMGTKRPFLSIDGLTCQKGDVIDIGNPIKNGTNIPVVIKTLVFEKE